MEKTVYVIGHINPDTDAVVSAYGYAKLKNLLGMENYKPARAGHLNPQTSYIFEKFNVERPEYIADLVPKVKYFVQENHQHCIPEGLSYGTVRCQLSGKRRPLCALVCRPS